MHMLCMHVDYSHCASSTQQQHACASGGYITVNFRAVTDMLPDE